MKFEQLLRDESLLDPLRKWWRGLEEDRGSRAKLRRCKTPEDVFISPAYRRGVLPEIHGTGVTMSVAEQEKLALPVGVLAWAKPSSSGLTFPAMLGSMDKASQEVRDARFLKLLAIEDDDRDGLYRMLIRLVRMVDGKADLASLVRGAALWNDDVRREWAVQYYSPQSSK